MDIQELPVESDTDLSSMEKESWFTMTGDSKKISAGSRKRTIVDSFIEHPHFDADWFSIKMEDGGVEQCNTDSEAPDDAVAIIAVSGKMPVGCLTVKSKPRSTNHQSSVVNSKQIDPDAFE